MDFVIENYIWFLIVGIVLIMALIGYIAEKTEFVKEKKPKEQKEKKETEETIEPDTTEPESEVVTLEEIPTEETTDMMEWDMPQINENVSQVAENVQSNEVDEMVDADENTSGSGTDDVVDLFEEVEDAPQMEETVSEMEIPKEEEVVTLESDEQDHNDSSEIVPTDSDVEKNETEEIVADEDIWKF